MIIRIDPLIAVGRRWECSEHRALNLRRLDWARVRALCLGDKGQLDR